MQNTITKHSVFQKHRKGNLILALTVVIFCLATLTITLSLTSMYSTFQTNVLAEYNTSQNLDAIARIYMTAIQNVSAGVTVQNNGICNTSDDYLNAANATTLQTTQNISKLFESSSSISKALTTIGIAPSTQMANEIQALTNTTRGFSAKLVWTTPYGQINETPVAEDLTSQPGSSTYSFADSTATLTVVGNNESTSYTLTFTGGKVTVLSNMAMGTTTCVVNCPFTFSHI